MRWLLDYVYKSNVHSYGVDVDVSADIIASWDNSTFGGSENGGRILMA